MPRSRADTWTIPLASISNDTSIWGTPRGAGGNPTCHQSHTDNKRLAKLNEYLTYLITTAMATPSLYFIIKLTINELKSCHKQSHQCTVNFRAHFNDNVHDDLISNYIVKTGDIRPTTVYRKTW